jgi:hypothetical protein
MVAFLILEQKHVLREYEYRYRTIAMDEFRMAPGQQEHNFAPRPPDGNRVNRGSMHDHLQRKLAEHDLGTDRR